MIDSHLNSNCSHAQVLMTSNFTTQTPDLSKTPYSPSDSNSPPLPHTSLSPEEEGDNDLYLTKSNAGRPPKQYPSHYFNCDPDQKALLDQVLETFTYIETNIYITTPRSKKEDLFICSCKYQKGISPLEEACGRPDCANRCLYIECDKNCPTGKYCQNKRFQNRQYSKVNLIQTLKKGYGLSAAEHVKKDEFIMEYIGEVITTAEFQDRSVDYSEAGYRHFYFMQSQNGEIIDATKKGCLSRFVNHSCNPNCILQKWQIGNRHRIGLFSLRDIEPGEEFTFDYRSTRFGDEDQPCYCGEENCRGFISNSDKSGSKNRHVFDPEDPMVPFYDEDEVAEHVKLMRQCNDDPELALLYLGKLNHPNSEKLIGASIKCQVFIDLNQWLHTYENDAQVVKSSLEALIKLPFQYRNKIEQYNIDDTVKKFLIHHDPEIEELASATLEKWDSLKSVYRIPLIKNNSISQMMEDSTPLQSSSTLDSTNIYPIQYPMYSSGDLNTAIPSYNANFRRKMQYPRYPVPESLNQPMIHNAQFPYPPPYNPSVRINTTNPHYTRYRNSQPSKPAYHPPSKSVSLSSSPSQVSKISNDSPAPSSIVVRVPIPPPRDTTPTLSYDSIKIQWEGLPKPYSAFLSPDRQVFFYNNITKKAQWMAPEDSIPRIEGQSQAAIDSVIEMAKQFAEKTRVDSGHASPISLPVSENPIVLPSSDSVQSYDLEHPAKRKLISPSGPSNKDLIVKLRAQLCDAVRKSFSAYQSRMDRELFKKHCRKIVHTLLSKEQKTRDFRKGRLVPNDALFHEKVQKFVDNYASKLLILLESKQSNQLNE